MDHAPRADAQSAAVNGTAASAAVGAASGPYARYLSMVDPAADAVAAAFAELPAGARPENARPALANGIDAVVHAPPALVELFAQLDAPPVWVDWERVDRGGAVFLRSGMVGMLALQAARLPMITGDYPNAIAAADRVRSLMAPGDDPLPMVGALLDKAQALIFTGDPATAEACLHEALPLARGSCMTALECVALNRLNTIAQDRGDYQVGREHLRQALAVARASGNRRFQAALEGNLGKLEARLGNYAEARSLLQSGLTLTRAIGDRGSEPYTLSGLAMVAHEQGDPAAALSLCSEALAIAVEVADRGFEAECRVLVGTYHARLGQADEALACFDAADRSALLAVDGHLGVASQIARAELALAQRRLTEAEQHARRVLEWLDLRGSRVDGDDPARYLVCFRVLDAIGAPGADALLERAHDRLRAQADRLPAPDRTAYLYDILTHRSIVAAIAARAEAAFADAGLTAADGDRR